MAEKQRFDGGFRGRAATRSPGTAIATTVDETGSKGRWIDMATMYLMSLEDRVELARGQLDRVTVNLRSVLGQGRLEDVQLTVSKLASQLQDIRELIGN
jgi:hypothetical protein